MHEEQDKKGDEEEDAVHDAEREARLLHRALLLHAGREAARARDAVGADAQICGAAVREAGAVGAGDATELVDAGDEGADEAEVDEGDVEGGSLGGFAAEEGHDGPDGGEGGDDEEGENGGWGESKGFLVEVDEVCQHAQRGNERDDLEQAPKGEEDVPKHRGMLPQR